ncbi:hypothetical protein [Sphingomonas mollis]|uniref:Spore coat protein U domain-containing protein n=1 Tax=Sphingomonas mollis TaxID=2795726 RepID=A0ABS0XPU2_9SPHN|nr:hypothetical protein [Sphingomonas sp. BT553]MBJ6121743.1 hypothetical protein [Sphingomonas sp. BT553]
MALFVLTLAVGRAAACDVTLVAAGATMRLDYDAFAFSRTVGRQNFELENRDKDACTVDLLLLNAERLPVGDAVIPDTDVRVAFSSRAGSAAVATTATPGIWRITMAGNGRMTVPLEALVTQDAVPEAGDHALDLMLDVRDIGAPATNTAPAPVRVLLSAVPRAQMNIAGAAGTFGEGSTVSHIDFGILASDATRSVFLQVRANTTARLTIDSAHRGRLLLKDKRDGDEGFPYQARLRGEEIDLTRHWEQVIEAPRSAAGMSIPLELRLGTVGPHVAGDYEDVLTLEISAL